MRCRSDLAALWCIGSIPKLGTFPAEVGLSAAGILRPVVTLRKKMQKFVLRSAL
jgi:hypothetical protein